MSFSKKYLYNTDVIISIALTTELFSTGTNSSFCISFSFIYFFLLLLLLLLFFFFFFFWGGGGGECLGFLFVCLLALNQQHSLLMEGKAVGVGGGGQGTG